LPSAIGEGKSFRKKTLKIKDFESFLKKLLTIMLEGKGGEYE
jgi:hypothetical protein